MNKSSEKPQSWLLAKLTAWECGDCQRALTQDLWGGGALQVADLRLLEHGSEGGGALHSDAIGRETARKGQGGIMSEQAGQWVLTENRTLRAAAHLSEVTALPLSASQSLVMPLVV